MTIHFTIIGLGEIGTSIGLALKYQKDNFEIIGCDFYKFAEQQALESGAVVKIVHNICDSVKNADVIIFSDPHSKTEDLLKLIGNDVRDDAVILDMGSRKTDALGWAEQYLKFPAHFVGVYPTLNPQWLDETADGTHTAHEDLFKKGSLFIAAGLKADKSVVKLAIDFASLLGAYPIFIDAKELDAMISLQQLMPYLIACAMVKSVTGSSGWEDTRKMADKALIQLTGSMGSTADENSFSEIFLSHREDLIRDINQFASSLKELRDLLQERDAGALDTILKQAEIGRQTWFDDYEAGKWRNIKDDKDDYPSFGSMMGQMFLGGLSGKKKD